MWFKNMKVFRLAEHWVAHMGDIDVALRSEAFTPADDLSATSTGWVPPREDDDRFALDIQGQYLMRFRLEKKLLPATVINQTVKARAQTLEAEQGWAPGRKQMKDLKVAITDELLPRAFSIARDVNLWIDPANRWLVIDAAAASQSDEVLSALGRTLNPYPVEPLQLAHSPASLMTNWMIEQEAPAGLSLDDDSQWQASGEATSSIRYVRHDLTPQTIKEHVESGFQCVRASLTWQDRISFVLTDTGDLKKVTPLDILQDREGHGTSLTASEKFESDFVLMTAEVSQLLGELMPVLGQTDGDSET